MKLLMMKYRPALTLALAIVLLLFSFIDDSIAADLINLKTFNKVTINADSLSIDDQFHSLSATGHVVIQSENFNLKADNVNYETKSQTLSASGNVIVNYSKEQIKSDNIKINFQTEQIHIENIVFIKKGTNSNGKYIYKIEGAILEKTNDNRWQIAKANYTACDCGSDSKPSWSVSCSKADVYEDRTLSLEKPVFKIKEVPVFALPSVTLPLEKRKAGFLMPSLSYTDETGAEISEDFFLVINDHNDMTFGISGLTKKGVMPKIELRSLSTTNRMKLNGFYLYDLEGNKSGTAYHRYSILLDQKMSVAGLMNQKTDLSILSDTYITNDFGKNWRSRNLDFSHSSFELNLSKNNFFWGIAAEYCQYLFDPAFQNGNLLTDFEEQNLATIETMTFSLNMFPLFNGRLFLDLLGTMQLHYLNYSADTVETDVSREQMKTYALLYSIKPKFLLPVRLGKYANFNFNAGIKHEGFFNFNDNNAYSGATRVNLSAFLESRIFRVLRNRQNKLKHSIVPSLKWQYAYSLEHGKNVKLLPMINFNEDCLPMSVKIAVNQSLAIKKHNDKLGTVELNIYQRFLLDRGKFFRLHNYIDDTVFELNAQFKKATIKTSFGIDIKNGNITTQVNRLMLGSFNGVSFNLQYLYLDNGIWGGEWLFQNRYKSESVNQLSVNPVWDINRTVRIGYLCDISFKYNKLIEHGWYLKYRSPCNCWSMSLNITHRPEMDFPDVFFSFDLSALVN